MNRLLDGLIIGLADRGLDYREEEHSAHFNRE